MRVPRIALVAVAAVACSAAPANASELIARNATQVRLEVNRDGKALLTYRSQRKVRRVLAWGAINAAASESGRRQVAFQLDYSGGWGKFRVPVWKTFEDACAPARVPLAWLVTACRAPDGSYWAVQSWQRTLPVYGMPAAPGRDAWELRLSHWSGPVPDLEVRFGWTYRRFHQIFGRFTYRGLPVYGFSWKPTGEPLDDYGRNIYVDTLDSAYGKGWHRENGFLTHRPTGGFCYGFYPHGDRPSGRGVRYRATVMGPGVAPDAYWEGSPPLAYDRGYDLLADSHLLAMLVGDPVCEPH
jgi:hypothetical protein